MRHHIKKEYSKMKFLVLLAALAVAKGQDCPPPTTCPDGMTPCAPPPPPMRDVPMCPPDPICFPVERKKS